MYLTLKARVSVFGPKPAMTDAGSPAPPRKKACIGFVGSWFISAGNRGLHVLHVLLPASNKNRKTTTSAKKKRRGRDLIRRSKAKAIGGVHAAYDLQPLAFAGVDHVEGGAGVDVEDVAHLELPLHELVLVNIPNLRFPCSSSQYHAIASHIDRERTTRSSTTRIDRNNNNSMYPAARRE